MKFTPDIWLYIWLIFHPLEVVSRWRDPQLQVGENYSDLSNLRRIILKSCWSESKFSIKRCCLILSSLKLPLSSSSTTSRDLISICSGWRWLEVGGKRKKISLLLKKSSMKIILLQTIIACRKWSHSSERQKWWLNASSKFKGLNC